MKGLVTSKFKLEIKYWSHSIVEIKEQKIYKNGYQILFYIYLKGSN